MTSGGTCDLTGKRIHASKAAAKRAARALNRYDGAAMSWYRCAYCRGWHAGRTPPSLIARGVGFPPRPDRAPADPATSGCPEEFPSDR